MQSVNGEPGSFRGDPAAGRAGFEITKRVLFLAFLIGTMLIPLYMIRGLVEERFGLSQNVAATIAGLWGGSQLVAGPVVTIPYISRKETVVNGAAVVETEKRYAQFLPDSLSITATAKTEKRYKGIYEVLVYAAEIHMSGRLPAPSFEGRGIAPGDILWDEATVALGITDMGGIRHLALSFDGHDLQPIPGLLRGHPFASGLHARLAGAAAQAAHAFSLDLTLDGSGELQFLPLGNETTLEMTADWPSPGFIGNFLPMERRIDAKGFSARWTVSSLARNYPQSWTSEELDFSTVNDGQAGDRAGAAGRCLSADRPDREIRRAGGGAHLRHHLRGRAAARHPRPYGAVSPGRLLHLPLLSADALARRADRLPLRLCHRERRRCRHDLAVSRPHGGAPRRNRHRRACWPPSTPICISCCRWRITYCSPGPSACCWRSPSSCM